MTTVRSQQAPTARLRPLRVDVSLGTGFAVPA